MPAATFEPSTLDEERSMVVWLLLEPRLMLMDTPPTPPFCATASTALTAASAVVPKASACMTGSPLREAASAILAPVCAALTTGLLALTVRTLCLTSWTSRSCAVSVTASMRMSRPTNETSPWRDRMLLPRSAYASVN
ncbi:hypothetical protein ANDO1_4161 [plant metagenome]|uniref:Uncharacterized protein n=1 Tax=plant metagenome TaxID=1297885 RepID=A0A484PN33_9ZZZZ